MTAALDAALAGVVPSLPLTLEDAIALFDLMRGIAKPPLILDSMHDRKSLVLRIFDGKRQIYEKRLQAR